MVDDREELYRAVREAVAPLSEKTPYPEWEASLAVSRTSDITEPWETFRSRFETAHGVFFDQVDSLAKFLKEKECLKGYVDAGLMDVFASALEGFSLTQKWNRKEVDSYDFTITQASGVIAETGTLVLKDHGSVSRLAAVAPWVHVAVVSATNIFETVEDAIREFGSDPSIIFVTGPSKTADVEGILIEGVHGPGVQACFRIS